VPREAKAKEHHLTSTRADPLASLRVAGVQVVLPIGGFAIPALPAARWLEFLLDDTFRTEEVFPGLCGPDATAAVYEALIEGTLTEQEVADTVTDILETVSGRRWWITLRLCRVAREHWDVIGGALLLAGVDVQKISLGAWTDAVLTLMIDRLSNADPAACAQFTQTLVTPPAALVRQEIDDVAEGNAFLASMRMAM